MKKTIISTIIILMTISIVKSQSYQIIINNSNTVQQLSKKQVSDFFLKKKTKWPDKTRVIPIDLSSKSTVRKDFSRAIHKKSTNQVRAFWQQSVFSGKATPPREIREESDLINYVKKNKGAIGYISSNTKATGVKVLIIK